MKQLKTRRRNENGESTWIFLQAGLTFIITIALSIAVCCIAYNIDPKMLNDYYRYSAKECQIWIWLAKIVEALIPTTITFVYVWFISARFYISPRRTCLILVLVVFLIIIYMLLPSVRERTQLTALLFIGAPLVPFSIYVLSKEPSPKSRHKTEPNDGSIC